MLHFRPQTLLFVVAFLIAFYARFVTGDTHVWLGIEWILVYISGHVFPSEDEDATTNECAPRL